MDGSSSGSPDRGKTETTSLFGLVSFQPRLAVVLVFLTITLAVVAVRMTRDTSLSRVESLAVEAMRIQRDPGGTESAPLDPAEVEERVRRLTGAKIALPRDGERFAFTGVTRGKVGRLPAAAVRLTFAGDSYLLLVMRREPLRARSGSDDLFPGSGFLSGEREGRSFVYWEREGASLIIVTSADLTSTFDLVRRYFS